MNFDGNLPPHPPPPATKRRTLVVVSRMISLCRSSTTIFTWPSLEARCKPFSPFCEEQRGRDGGVRGSVRPAGPGGWTKAPDREGPCKGPEGETPSGVNIGAGQSQPVTKACLTVKC